MNNTTYKIKTIDEEVHILRIDYDGIVWWVPEALGNRHYEEYLEWLAEGNEPEVINDQS